MKKFISVILTFIFIAAICPAIYADNSLHLLNLDEIDALRQANPDYDIQVSPEGSITFELFEGQENYFSFPSEILMQTDWSDYYTFSCTIAGLNEKIQILVCTDRDNTELYSASSGPATCKTVLPENKRLIKGITEIIFMFDAPQSAHSVTISGMTLDTDNTAEVYTHDSALCTSVTGIQIIDSPAAIETLTAEKKPAIALFYPSADMSVQQAVAACAGNIIPAFYITEDTFEQVMSYYTHDSSDTDVFIVSDSAELLYAAYKLRPNIGRILCVNGDVSPAQIHTMMNTAMARIVLLSNEAADKQTVRYLCARFDTVWVNAKDKTQLYRAVTSGAAGVVTENVQDLYDVCDTFTENALMNPSYIVGHRGIPSLMPENTIEGYLLAIEKGATHVECDIYITTDDYIVISHDGTTGRCGDRDISIERSTLAQVKEVNLENGYKIPELKEFLSAIKPTEALAVIEIKSTQTKAVDKTIQIIREMGMEQRCVFISFHVNQLNYLAQTYPEFACSGYLGSVPNGKAPRASLDLANTVRPINGTIDLSYGGINKAFMQNCLHRGMTTWGWTVNDAGLQMQFFTQGMTGITTNTANNFSDRPYEIASPAGIGIIKDGKITGLDTATLQTYDKTQLSVKPNLMILDPGSANLSQENGAITAQPGEATVIFYAPLADYTLYTQPQQIQIRLYGDLTNDNDTSLADIIALAKLILEQTPLDARLQKIADVNTDDAVSLADIVTLGKYIIQKAQS